MPVDHQPSLDKQVQSDTKKFNVALRIRYLVVQGRICVGTCVEIQRLPFRKKEDDKIDN